MQNPDSSLIPEPKVQMVSLRDFPFQDAVLLEECCWNDVDVMRKECRGNIILLVAMAMRSKDADVLEEVVPSTTQESLVGFLVSDMGRDEEGKVHGSLINLAVSLLEEQPDSVRVALIRHWQEVCRQELWDDLQASLRPDQEEDRAIFCQEGFHSLGTCPCCNAEMLEWTAAEAQSHT